MWMCDGGSSAASASVSTQPHAVKWRAMRRLEIILHRDLHLPRGRRPDDLAERRAHDVPLDCSGAVELRPVEHVERLEAQLNRAVAAGHLLDQRQVGVLDARAVEE